MKINNKMLQKGPIFNAVELTLSQKVFIRNVSPALILACS